MNTHNNIINYMNTHNNRRLTFYLSIETESGMIIRSSKVTFICSAHLHIRFCLFSLPLRLSLQLLQCALEYILQLSETLSLSITFSVSSVAVSVSCLVSLSIISYSVAVSVSCLVSLSIISYYVAVSVSCLCLTPSPENVEGEACYNTTFTT